jgi:hypothetical protein
LQENGGQKTFSMTVPAVFLGRPRDLPLSVAPSSLPPVSEIFLARSNDRVALLAGFPPILLHQSVILSIGDIFLVIDCLLKQVKIGMPVESCTKITRIIRCRSFGRRKIFGKIGIPLVEMPAVTAGSWRTRKVF